MKYIKIIMILVTAALTVACSNDDDKISFNPNTTDATVQFARTSVTLKESVNYVELPIMITGNRDGFITVNAALKSNPAEFDLNSEVVITSYSFKVPADRQIVNLEVGLHVQTLDMNLGRNITFEITEVEGATLGTNTTATIHINEINPAEGIYTINGSNIMDEPTTGYWRFTAKDETYNQIYLDLALGGQIPVKFTEILPDEYYTISIQSDKWVGKYTENGKSYNVYLARIDYNAETKKYEKKETPISGGFSRKVEDDTETITITINTGFGLYYLDENEELQWFMTDSYKPKAVMTKERKK